MKPEQLKVIAIGMGYETRIDNGYVDVLIGVVWIRYNPLKDNDQMVDIMEELKRCMVWSDWETLMQEIYATEGRISEVLCSTAYDHYRGKL